jgi:hypothetical protein
MIRPVVRRTGGALFTCNKISTGRKLFLEINPADRFKNGLAGMRSK